MAFGAIEPFLAWLLSVFIPYLRLSANAQHGERMATWALRMCLLRRPSAGCGGGCGGPQRGTRAYHMATARALAVCFRCCSANNCYDVLAGASFTRVVVRPVPDRCGLMVQVQGLRGKLAAACAGQER